MATPADLNPLSNFKIGSLSTFGSFLLGVVIVVLILGLIGVLIYFWLRKRQYKYIIPLYARVGNEPTRIATYRAKEVRMGRAGDSLWFVGRAKKFIPPPTIQSAPREYWHWLREDGEWINFSMKDLDEESKKANVKYIHQDMRMTRLATDKLLEQRLMSKSFLEKWGLVLGYIVFFLVLTVAMVIIFYQFSSVVDKVALLLDRLDSLIVKADRLHGGDAELIPALVPLLLIKFGVKKWHL